jgi:hypothetical protein
LREPCGSPRSSVLWVRKTGHRHDPESLCPMQALPASGRRAPSPPRTLLLSHRSYGLMRRSRYLASTSALASLRSLCRLLSAPAANGIFSTLFCESFLGLGCLVPCHGGPIGCPRLLLPRCHRPFSKRDELASRFFPRTRLFVGSFSRLQTFRYVQAPKFARLRDRSHRCSLAAGRPRLLHPGRTCFVASARTGHARRPNTGN